MRVIRLRGALGRKYGKVHRFDVRTPAEAVRALCANFPGFEQELATSHERGVGYKCVVDRERIGEDRLAYPISRNFSITPVVHGSGKTLSIIMGVVLIGTALVLSGGTAGVALATAFKTGIGFLGLTYGNIALLGLTLVLSGISQLLAPTPKMAKPGEKEENPYFNGPVNTIAQGFPVPFGYGRVVVGSAVISAGITVESPVYDQPTSYLIGGYQDR